jgi:hypothetical protein
MAQSEISEYRRDKAWPHIRYYFKSIGACEGGSTCSASVKPSPAITAVSRTVVTIPNFGLMHVFEVPLYRLEDPAQCTDMLERPSQNLLRKIGDFR